MRDLKDRLRVLDQARAPDMWRDASTRRAGDRAPTVGEPVRARTRVYAAALAIVVMVGATALVWRAFEGADDTNAPVSSSPSISQAPRQPSFDGWTVTAVVTPTRSGPLRFSIGAITATPPTNSRGWLQHDFTIENAGSETLRFDDTRTSVFLGPPRRSLIAADPGCGYAANSKTAPVHVGACLAYLDSITLAPGKAMTRQIGLSKELNGMPALTPGDYTFTKVLRYTVVGHPSEETEATVRITYTIEEATGPGVATPIPATRVCEAPIGSVNDVAHEPNWRRWADYADWSTDDGCLVRIDVLAERPGPSHCQFEDAQVLITGNPLGSPYGEQHSMHFIRDPKGVFGDPALVEGFDPDATLPSDATYSGFRSETRQLWTAPSDPDAVYVVEGDSVERWPAGEQLVCL